MFKRQKIHTNTSLIFLSLLLLFISCTSREGPVEPTYAVSGTVTLIGTENAVAGVTMQLTGAASASTTTDSNGNFSFTGLADGNYTVTPSLSDYIFDPVSAAITINGDDVSGTDFMATAPAGTNFISGQVTGAVLNGVTMTLSGTANTTISTDASGNYSFTGLAAGNYTVTPSLTDYGFDPVNLAVNISGASQTGKNFTATLIPTSSYAQSDLTGRWKIQELSTDSSSQWMRAIITIDASGVITCESYEESTGDNTCPDPLVLKWEIDEDGKITESGAQGIADTHISMASNKNFIAGTGSLRIGQKIATTFNTTDLNITSFVYHQLKVGGINEWRYGAGTIGSDGTMSVTSETRSVSAPATGTIGILSVDTSGIITFLSGHNTFKGFLSDDKKTIVATETDATGYILTIIQITGKSYSAGSLPDSISNVHMLAGGTSPAPLNAYWTATTFNGTMAASNYGVSNTDLPAPVPSSPLVNANGVVTISGDTYHGQVSYDDKFTIGTKTLYNDTTPFGYAMIVNTVK